MYSRKSWFFSVFKSQYYMTVCKTTKGMIDFIIQFQENFSYASNMFQNIFEAIIKNTTDKAHNHHKIAT